jgi:hypothetical protein
MLRRYIVREHAPVWERTLWAVTVPDDIPAAEVHDYVMEQVNESRAELVYTEVRGSIEGMDADYGEPEEEPGMVASRAINQPVQDHTLLQEAREHLIARDPDYLSLDDAIGQFALDLAAEKLQEAGVREVLDPDGHQALVETVAIATATGMHVVLEASDTALDRIQALLSGQEWTADVTGAIADVVRATGREVSDPAEHEANDG